MEPKKIIKTILDEENELFEFLLEEADEFLSLDEAIKLARNGGIADVQVCRSKKGKTYLRAKHDKTKSNNLRNLAPKPCCGPEIKTYVERQLKDVREAFFGWSADKQSDCCSALTNPSTAGGAWDITQLHTTTGEPALLDALMRNRNKKLGGLSFNDYGCGTGKCRQTVMVGGQCFRSWEVNYALFGAMFHLCHDYYPVEHVEKLWGFTETFNLDPNNNMRDTPISEAEYIQYAKDFISDYFSFETAKNDIWSWQTGIGAKAYRFVFYPDRGASYKDGDAIPKQQWARIGYKGAYGTITPPAKGTRGCRKCIHDARLYQMKEFFPFRAKWNGNDIPEYGK